MKSIFDNYCNNEQVFKNRNDNLSMFAKNIGYLVGGLAVVTFVIGIAMFYGGDEHPQHGSQMEITLEETEVSDDLFVVEAGEDCQLENDVIESSTEIDQETAMLVDSESNVSQQWQANFCYDGETMENQEVDLLEEVWESDEGYDLQLGDGYTIDGIAIVEY